jgi:multidrug efflux pump subunit AcrA (membrane-fusion protein)
MKCSKFPWSLIVGALVLSGCKQEKAPPLSGANPPQVVVATVEQRDVPIVREWIGQLDGSENVDVRARVHGYIQEIAFKEGTVVKPGDLLLRIDLQMGVASIQKPKIKLVFCPTTERCQSSLGFTWHASVLLP